MRFLASVKFAIILIFTSAVLVIAGTVLESKHDSHQIAENWIYHNPIFQVLLAGYFVNILLSALSRYPFKKRHIPFLITHLGLLMIISGVFIKTQFGVQGHMQLIEGSASDDLIYPNKPALYVENRRGHSQSIPIEAVNVLEHHPHAEETYEYWHKDKPVSIPKLEEWIAYDKGFLGYTVQVDLPTTPDDEHLIQDIGKQKFLSKPLQVMRAASNLIDFPKALIQYLKAWDNAGTWLYDMPFPAPIDWKTLKEYSALYWIAELFDETDFLEHLENNGWPLIQSLRTIQGKENQYEEWMNQIYSVQHELPEPPEFIDSLTYAKMLSAYLRLHSIHYSNIPKQILPFELPLAHSIVPKKMPSKPEDARPAVVIGFANEKISLVYDPHKSGLKWPSQDGSYLFKFQPYTEKLPYSIRVHRALDIKHPGSEQTASYECSLSVKDNKSGIITPCTLQMNQVYETDDGYRFYLAGIGKIDSYGVRSVQLVVNRDPAKMFLTYPGALLVALGIIGLFFLPKGKNV